MNILYDYQIFSAQKYGGISRFFYEIIKRIAIDNKVYAFEGLHINKYGLDNEKHIYKIFSKERPAIKYTGFMFRRLNRIMFKNFAAKNPIDIYHPTYYEDLNINKGKLVVTVYDMIHELYYKNDVTVLKKKNLIEKADGIIAISESTKKDLIDILNIKPEKIQVIYLANSLEISEVGQRVIKIPYILYVGNRGEYKNFETCLKAFAESKFKNEVLFVCFGGGNFTQSECALINELGLERQVKQFFGDDKVLANLYKYAELFVYPSKYEGFGLPPLEAMKYGTPVVVSNTSSIPEVVGDAGIYFDPDAVDDICFKIDTVLSSIEIQKQLAEKGKQREKMFSWDKCAKETVTFYQRVISRGLEM